MTFKVGIIMGSASDLEVMSGAINTLEQFGIGYEKRVISAHRAPDALAEWSKTAKERGHATTADAAKVAQMAGAGRLLIGHFSSRYKDLEALLAESREIFPATDIARERETFLIEPKATKL